MSVKIKINHIAFLVRIAFGLNSSYFSFLGHREILIVGHREILIVGQCFSIQGVIHVNFGKKNETSNIKFLQLGSNCLHQDSCNFENRILHQFKK